MAYPRNVCPYRKCFIDDVLYECFRLATSVFCKDDEGKDNGLKFPESALNKLFGEDRLGKARSQLADNKKQGYEDIDRLFD